MKLEDFLSKEKIGAQNYKSVKYVEEINESIVEGAFNPSTRLKSILSKLDQDTTTYNYGLVILSKFQKVEKLLEENSPVSEYTFYDIRKTYEKLMESMKKNSVDSKEDLGKLLGAAKFSISYLFETEAEFEDIETHPLIKENSETEFDLMQALM